MQSGVSAIFFSSEREINLAWLAAWNTTLCVLHIHSERAVVCLLDQAFSKRGGKAMFFVLLDQPGGSFLFHVQNGASEIFSSLQRLES